MFSPVQGRMFATLTPTALQWFAQGGACFHETGLPAITDEAVEGLWVSQGVWSSAAGYRTAWLNPEPAHAVRDAATPKRDAFMESVLEVARADEGETGPPAGLTTPPTVQTVVLTRLMAAARDGRDLIAATQSRKIKPEDAKLVLALLDAALGDAAAAITPRPAPEVE